MSDSSYLDSLFYEVKLSDTVEVYLEAFRHSLLACEMKAQLYDGLNIQWHCIFGIGDESLPFPVSSSLDGPNLLAC